MTGPTLVPADRGLLLDYGGVLTGPVGTSFATFERALGIPAGRSFQLLLAASQTPGGGLIGALERGEMSASDFDRHLAELLERDGYEVSEAGLLTELFAGLEPSGALWQVATQARSAGVATGLLSNSWGTDIYPRQRLQRHFDVLVISAEVGLRKPDPAIYLLACERLGLPASRCAFVDDLPSNVEVARELGMFAVHHEGDETAVISALSDFLEIELHRP